MAFEMLRKPQRLYGNDCHIAGCEGYGCEPVFALAYIRHTRQWE